MGFSGDEAELRREIAEQEAIVRETGDATDEAGIRKRGRALWRIAKRLQRLEHWSEAAERYKEAELLLWQLDKELDRGMAVNSCGQRAVALMRLERYREAADVLSDLAGRVDLNWSRPGATGSEADSMIAAMGLWPWLLTKAGDFDAAHAAANRVITAYEPGSTGQRRHSVALAFETRGDVARERGNDAEALADFEEAMRRYERGQGADALRKASVTRARLSPRRRWRRNKQT